MAVAIPQGFELSDPGTGGRLVASILNRTDYGEGTRLLIQDISGATITEGDASVGIVNIFGLTDGIPSTFKSVAVCGSESSLESNEDTETPSSDNVALLKGDTEIFREVQVRFSPIGGSLITWCLREPNDAVGPLTFFVQFSTGPDLAGDHWEDAVTVVDEFEGIDQQQRLFNSLDITAYYRVLLRDANGVEFISEAIQAIGHMSRHDYLIARSIIRKEQLRLSRFVGKRGTLHKRKIFGDECTDCLDQDTGAIVDNSCVDCFGTGIIGGYHKPIEFFVEMGLKGRRVARDVNHGQQENVTIQCRCLGCPELNEGDLWIREDTGERFFIREIRDAAHLGVPLVIVANFRKIPLDDIAYNVPGVA